MYESFYGLSDKPFALTPNPRFVFYTQQYREAEGQLLYGIGNREGFMLVTGRPGCGKTTLCRDLIEKLDRTKVHSALLFNPFLNAFEMLAALLNELGLTVPAGATRKDLLDRLNQFLLAQLTLGKSCVAIFDEAQHLSAELLEQIRVLSNLETDQEKLLQIVLVGQPELIELLQSPAMAQLDQRVSIRCTVTDLDRQETDRYIHHRLNIAGARGQVRFTSAAVRGVFEASHGVPRLINLICDRALLAGYAEQTRDIGPSQVKKAVLALRGTESDLGLGARATMVVRRRTALATSVGTAALAGLAFFLWQRNEAGKTTDASLFRQASQAPSAMDAERYYTELTALFPQSTYATDAYLALAQIQMSRPDYPAALRSLKQATTRMQIGPARSRAIVQTAAVQLSAGDTTNACQTLGGTDSIVRRDPVLRPLVVEVEANCGGNHAQLSGGSVAPESTSAAPARGRVAADSLGKRPLEPRVPAKGGGGVNPPATEQSSMRVSRTLVPMGR